MILGTSQVAKAAEHGASEHSTKHDKHLVGTIDKAALQQPPFQYWYTKNYSSYSPNKADVEALAAKLDDIHVKVFMGTWCHDSQREVPRLYKILESSNFDLSNLSLVSLSSAKSTPDGLETGLNIQRTPTFIFYRDAVEIGRIVETPRVSIEADILKVVSGLEYKHSYQE